MTLWDVYVLELQNGDVHLFEACNHSGPRHDVATIRPGCSYSFMDGHARVTIENTNGASS